MQIYKTKKKKARKSKKRFKKCVKAGFCHKTGKQRWYDKEKKKYFLKEYVKRGYSNVRKKRAIALAEEGNGFRAIGRLLKISHTCAYYWIRAHSEKIKMQTICVEPHMSLELDEMWGFCGEKK